MNYWEITFQVFDTSTGEWIRDETNHSLEESIIKEIETKHKNLCDKLKWKPPHFNVFINITHIQEKKN